LGPFRFLYQFLHNFDCMLDTLYRADRFSRPERHRFDCSRRGLVGNANLEAKNRDSRPVQAAPLTNHVALQGIGCRD
jgi:hypothetical protein